MAKAPLEIRSLARQHTIKALQVLVDIMEQPNAPHAARTAAAQYLLDRGWGKAVQAIEVSGEIASKVIRSPSVSDTAKSWATEHVPEQHTEH